MRDGQRQPQHQFAQGRGVAEGRARAIEGWRFTQAMAAHPRHGQRLATALAGGIEARQVGMATGTKQGAGGAAQGACAHSPNKK